MPTDFDSTARALALPVSPPLSPNPSTQPVRVSWQRSQSASSHRRSHSTYDQDRTSFRDRMLSNVIMMQRQAYRTAKKLSLLQRVSVVVAGFAILTFAILFFIYNERIFAWLEPVADRWKNLRGGWLILWFMTFATAFPPVIGYSSCLTIAGFVWGFPNGWFIGASATIVGSLCSFLLSRTLLSQFVNRLVANDSRFAALSLVLKHDGLKLLVMIRLCPLPYSLSNGALSTIATVKPLIFALATTIASPKLMIHVFIGSRLAEIAKKGEKMDRRTKAINYASIVGGMILGIVTGYVIYQRTVARSRELEAEERNAQKSRRNVRLPPPTSFVDDPEAVDVEREAGSNNNINNDVIDFLDPEAGEEGYRDDSDDGEDDDDNALVGYGDRTRDEVIGLDRR